MLIWNDNGFVVDNFNDNNQITLVGVFIIYSHGHNFKVVDLGLNGKD